jgi:hypothetical protein
MGGAMTDAEQKLAALTEKVIEFKDWLKAQRVPNGTIKVGYEEIIVDNAINLVQTKLKEMGL